MIKKYNHWWLAWAQKGGWLSFARRYGLAVVFVLGAMLLRDSFTAGYREATLFLACAVAIALSAGLGGLGPGMLATLLAILSNSYWLLEPRGPYTLASSHFLGDIAALLLIGGLLSFIFEMLYRARLRALEQSEQFRVIFERAFTGKALIDLGTGRMILVNGKFCWINGYPEHELLQMRFDGLAHPEDRQTAAQSLGQLARGEITEFQSELRHVRGDGRVIWVELLLTLMRAEHGKPVQALASVLDITRRKQMEETLRESEARYRQVIRSAGCALIGMDRSGIITLYSGQAAQIFGYTEDEVLGRNIVGTIVPPRDNSGRDMRAIIQDLLQHSERYLYHENENMTRDGQRLWMAWTNRPILDEDGILREIICVGLDLTHRKRIEDSLHLSEERFRAAFEYAPMGFEQISLDGRLLDVNNALCHMLGYSREELLGKPFLELTHPEDREAEDKLLQPLLAGDVASYQVEKRNLRQDGEPVWVRVTSSLTKHPVPYRISIVEDITRQKQAEALFTEHSFLHQVIDAVPSLIFVKDWEGRFILANEALARGYGTTVQGIVGKTDTDFNTCTDELERFWRDDHQVMSERREMQIPEEKVTYANGEVHWFSTVKVPLLNEDGLCDKVLGVASDITERKQAEEALRASEEHYRSLFEAIPQMVWTIRPDGFQDFCNHHWYDYTGLTWEETIHSGWTQALHPDEAKAALEAWLQAFSSGQPLEAEGRVRRASDGMYRWHYCRILPVRDEEQRIVKWIGTSIDIHERHVAEEKLHELNDRLAEANQQKDQFLAMLAHELRNPLAPLRNAIQILKIAAPPEPILQRQRDIIERQVGHMARLVDDLLDVSRVTRGKITLKNQPVRLVDVFTRAVESISPLIEARRHALSVTPVSEDLKVYGDFDRLIQIVGNLLSNSAKYTDEGGRIWLGAAREGREVVIRVRDTGMGIAPEMLPRIFDIFTQAERSLDRSQGGLGLGLTLVRSLVQMHGGSVEARSAGVDQGSEFIVRLPELPKDALESADNTVAANTHPAPRRKVLVVDDVVDTADSLAELLNLSGHETRTAYDGDSALRIAREFRPDVILLDIGLPGTDGFEVARQLRRDPDMSRVVLAALTGYSQDEYRIMADQAGFDRLFTKPIEQNALMALLE